MNGLGAFHNFPSGDRIGDIAYGDVSHRAVPTRITIHYGARPIAVVDFISRPKEGLLAKIKRALVKRRRPLHDPY